MVLSLWKRFSDYVRYCYFHYTLVTTIVMLEPVERYAFNAFFTLFVSLFLYTSIIYLPGHLTMMCNFLMHVSGSRPYDTSGKTISN
ncbi:serine palmitoyltransferase small subunit A-like [Babylonia areolata]|uniref:serine palmitoyltransferase small subunit A-like n=1 Tax=Babylonia areolata TaxID=304850 RepID=UPI003FD390AF